MDIKILVHVGVEIVLVGVFCYILYQFYKKINRLKIEVNRLRSESFKVSRPEIPTSRVTLPTRPVGIMKNIPRRSPRRFMKVNSNSQASRSQFKNEETSSDSEEERVPELNLEQELSKELEDLQDGDSSSDTSDSEKDN